jgi:putative DNA methylase
MAAMFPTAETTVLRLQQDIIMLMKTKPQKETRQLAFDVLLHKSQTSTDEVGQYAIDEHFPEKFADELARLEAYNKHLFRPNTYLHKWWARRCGSTFRTILKQFVSDPSRRDYYSSKGLEGKIILDPMMGGGTTLHESIRLGANVIGADIDPIPIVQARASLASVALTELQAAFQQFIGELYLKVGDYFQTECPVCAETTDAQYTLYGVRKRCKCGEVVQVEQFDLRHEEGRIIRIWPNTWEITDTENEPQCAHKSIRLVTRDDKVCKFCGQKYEELLEVPYYKRYTPIAIAATCSQHKLFFRVPGSLDLEKINRADELRKDLDFGSIADFSVRSGPKSSDLLKRNIHSYLDVFTSRQLLYLSNSIEILKEYEGVVRNNIALLISTSLEFNSLLCGYKGWAQNRSGAIKHVFSHHAYIFPYTAAENNPVNSRKSSGNLHSLFQDRIVRGRKWAVLPVERKFGSGGKTVLAHIHGEFDGGTEVFHQSELSKGNQNYLLLHGSSSSLPLEDRSIDFIVTDPPYYDSVQYSDLATFFRVWLARLLPDEINWHYDESQSAVATKGNGRDTRYLTVLSEIFRECNRVLKLDPGRMVFTFHHWDPNAWADLTISLKNASFRLVNAHVVYSENPISIHIQNLNAIKHDTVLVLAPNESSAIRGWKPIECIESSDSETFCRQCGMALGWLLDNDHSPEEIREIWKKLIQGKTDDSSSR